MRWFLVVLTFAGAAQAAEVDLGAVRDANVTYGRCVVQRARQLGHVKELPQDIVDASFGYCISERAALAGAISAVLRSTGSADSAKSDAEVNEAEKVIRRAAIRAVLEVRYP